MVASLNFNLKVVILVISVNIVEAQILGNLFRDPLNNLIKVFDGSYGANDNQNLDQYQNDDALLSYQPRAATNNIVYQLNGNCAGIWSYTKDSSGKTVGSVTIQNPNQNKNVLKLKLSLSASLQTNYVGNIDLAKDKDSTANDAMNGFPISYRVNFPVQNPLPKILTVTFNDQLLCSETGDSGSFTTLSLEHTLYTSMPQAIPNLVQSTPTIVQRFPEVETTPRTQRPAATRRHTTMPPTSHTQTYDESQDFKCGVPDFLTPEATGLVYGGIYANRRQFPWLAAQYHNGGSENGFICGGSLISPKLIVTAAHCVHNKGRDSIAISPDESMFYLGKYNLTNLLGENFYIVSGVMRFEVHPDWNVNDNKYDADIAIAVLVRTISFNTFIKPICLWTASTSFEDLVGHKVTVAGWGKTEFSALASDKPRFTEITVVSTVECLRSSPAFNDLTSDRTFCAGDKNVGNGPCNGDSGGGLIAKSSNKWFLRGIVSSSLLADGVCDTKNYAVFTDVQKFVKWIQRNVQTYD